MGTGAAIELENAGGAVGPAVGAISVLFAEGNGYGSSDSAGLATELDGAGAVGPAVGAITVLFIEGKGYGVSTGSTGSSEDELSGLTIELEGAVGPAVGAVTVLLADGTGYTPVPSLKVLDETGEMGSVGPAVGRTMLLFVVGRGNGAPVLIGATMDPEGAEPVGATTVPLPGIG